MSLGDETWWRYYWYDRFMRFVSLKSAVSDMDYICSWIVLCLKLLFSNSFVGINVLRSVFWFSQCSSGIQLFHWLFPAIKSENNTNILMFCFFTLFYDFLFWLPNILIWLFLVSLLLIYTHNLHIGNMVSAVLIKNPGKNESEH